MKRIFQTPRCAKDFAIKHLDFYALKKFNGLDGKAMNHLKIFSGLIKNFNVEITGGGNNG